MGIMVVTMLGQSPCIQRGLCRNSSIKNVKQLNRDIDIYLYTTQCEFERAIMFRFISP